MNYCIFGGNKKVPPKNSKKQLDSRSKITQYLCYLKLYVFCAILTAGTASNTITRAKKNPVQCVNLYVEFKTVPNFLKCVIA